MVIYLYKTSIFVNFHNYFIILKTESNANVSYFVNQTRFKTGTLTVHAVEIYLFCFSPFLLRDIDLVLCYHTVWIQRFKPSYCYRRRRGICCCKVGDLGWNLNGTKHIKIKEKEVIQKLFFKQHFEKKTLFYLKILYINTPSSVV